MATLRQLLQGTQKVQPSAIKRAPDGNNSPFTVFEVQKFKGVNSVVIRTEQKMSGRWPKGKRPTSRRGVYKQTVRFVLSGDRSDVNKNKPKASQDRVLMNCGCFTGDTKVILTDGTTATFKELCEKDFFIYSLDNNNKVQISDAVQCEIKEKNAKLVKVTLDNDFNIKCTLDHKFRLKDGTYKEAQYLTKGDSLAALYRRYSGEYKQDTLKGYELVKGPEDTWKYSHWIADEYNERFGLKQDRSAFINDFPMVRHHIDFNKKNNNPDNLVRMGCKEHFIYHSTKAKETIKLHGNPMSNPDTAAKAAKTQRENGHYDRVPKRMKQNNPMFNPEISKKVTETKRKNGDYTKLEKARNNSKIHQKRENLRNWVRDLPIGTIKVTQEIVNRLDYINSSCFGVALRSLIKEDEFKDLIVLSKQARNKPINITKTDGTNNHKVKSIEFLEEREDVYCLSVPEYGNFAIVADNSESLESGIFVHNCDNYYYMWWWGNKKAKAHEGGNYKPYTRKTDDRPEKNSKNIPGMCKHLVYVVQELKRKRLIQ